MGARLLMLLNMLLQTEEVLYFMDTNHSNTRLFISLGVILITRHSLDPDRARSIAKFNDWGWRIPFIVSILLVNRINIHPTKDERISAVFKIEGRGKNFGKSTERKFSRTKPI
jgi:hypothetical protein